MDNYGKVTGELKETFRTGKTLAYAFRLEQLKNLQRMLKERCADLEDALVKDLRKPKFEGLAEVIGIDAELSEAIRSLQNWMAPEKLPTNLLCPNDRAFIKHQPYGLVLILGAWNFPIVLTLLPLVGAIAAGNCAIIKPSEISPRVSACLAQILPKYLDSSCFRVVQGGIKETTELLKEKFDYIFSTSSSRVGRHVMKAAACHLTPVTLELGGKSPVYIHDSADLDLSVKRILWGKLMNAGQTCIAPDYVLCSASVQRKFIEQSQKVLSEWYGPDLQCSKDISRIVNEHHFNRLKKLLIETRGTVIVGGDSDSSDLWIAPTIVVEVEHADVLMEDEIFGPILPFVSCNSPEDAVSYINSMKAKPLALYLFSKDPSVNEMFLEKTSSGTFCINEVLMQCGWQGLPFGGVGESGMGKYRGKYSFDTFTHSKSVLERDFSLLTEQLSSFRYPPYDFTEFKLQSLGIVLKNMYRFKVTCSFGISQTFAFIGGLIVMYLFSLIDFD